jgi:hypothetical protein
MNADARDVLDDARANLYETLTDRRELGLGPAGLLRESPSAPPTSASNADIGILRRSKPRTARSLPTYYRSTPISM